MDTKYVQEFVLLAETQNYQTASEQLDMTTSSLSRHIKALEAEIGVTLFDRSTRKVTLTKHGSLLLPYAKQMVSVDQDCRKAIVRLTGSNRGQISIGSIPMLKAYGIHKMVQSFQQKWPNISINLIEADSLHLQMMLQRGECDVIFIRTRAMEIPDYQSYYIDQDQLSAVVPRQHPFASQDAISIRQLKGESLLLIGTNAFMYKMCTELCLEEGFSPRVVFTSRRAHNLLDQVDAGVGIALLTRKPVAASLPDSLTMVDITPPVRTSILMVYPSDEKLNPLAADFVHLCKEIHG
ncbi:MAG: LysR family transcriptional regulator [Clostridia bacterium]|nr:LysR family transcriptional regulator [Clostridia bacterium]